MCTTYIWKLQDLIDFQAGYNKIKFLRAEQKRLADSLFYEKEKVVLTSSEVPVSGVCGPVFDCGVDKLLFGTVANPWLGF